MKTAHQKVELLAPAGNFEKLEIALHYGADAVYLAGKAFSLRNLSGNFALDEMEAAIALAHAQHAKVYVAINIFARNEDLEALELYLHDLAAVAPDGLIVSDPAILTLTRKILPTIPIHLSTQANTTNAASACFWHSQGAQRINVARELSLAEIGAIAENCDADIEAFVHGAMCIAYSGRCLLSNFMAQRSSNQGICCQPCRFQYAVMEETRPGQFFPVTEDDHGTYIFNSRDLCMLAHLPEMITTGIRALKIEGRMKSIHYAATAVKVYREAIDSYYGDPARYRLKRYWQDELDKITSRGYCTGFYLGDSQQIAPQYSAAQMSKFPLAGKVLATAGEHKAHIEVRNQIQVGAAVEIVKPQGPPIVDQIKQIVDVEGQPIIKAQPGSRVTIDLSCDCRRFDLLRRCDTSADQV